MIDLPDVLMRIDAWYAAHAPMIHAQLRPGADDAALDELETVTGIHLPSSLRELYHWHDGEDWAVGGMFGLEFAPVAKVLQSWQDWHSIGVDWPQANEENESHSHPPGAIRDAYLCDRWLGFIVFNGQGYVGLDVDPGPAGHPLQVITYGRDETHKYVLADSLEEFLAEYLARLEAGRVTVENITESYPGNDPMWVVQLHDAAGAPGGDSFFYVADLFPGFGASPAVFVGSAER